MSGRPEDYDSPNDQAAYDELQRVWCLRAAIERELGVVMHTDYVYLRILEDLRELVLERYSQGRLLMTPQTRHWSKEERANAARIVACVNACEGCDPAKLRADHDAIVPELAALKAQLAEAQLGRQQNAQELDRVNAQRVALQAALEALVESAVQWTDETHPNVAAARAAIALSKGA